MDSQTSGALPIEKTTRPALAETITQEIVSLHDMRARKHDCPGYDCATCSLHGLQSQIEKVVGNGLSGMLAALKTAQTSLRAWNVMGISGMARKQVASAYENSPEMKAVSAAIAKLEGAQ